MAAKFPLKLVLPVLVLAGCTFLMGPDEPVGENTGTGTLTVSFGEAGGDRVISSGKDLPAEVLAGLRYEVSFNGPGGVVINRTVSGSETVSLSLTGGSWRIDASAYYGEALAGTGSLSFELRNGNTSVRVPMYMSGPLYEITIPPTAAGTVASNFNFAFPGTAITLTVTPAHSGAALKPNTLAVSGGALSGSGSSYTFAMPAADVTVTAEFLNGWRYVRETAAGTGDGSSWANASNDLQKMMDEAAAARVEGAPAALVRVAAGTYKPRYEPMVPASLSGPYIYNDTPGNPRDPAFILREGVEVRGGYTAAGEAIDEAARKARFDTYGAVDPMYRAVLSGDIGTPNLNTDNTYHVVLALDIPAGSGTILDGFTISGGYAETAGDLSMVNGGAVKRSGGGGIFIFTADEASLASLFPLPPGFSSSTPVLTNVTISGNHAHNTGGGIFNGYASPILTNVTISGNTSNSGGGGMINGGGAPVLTNVTISGNTSNSDGGGMYNTASSPVLNNVTISNNTSTGGSGGGMYNGGASPVLTDVTISNNTSTGGGGGMYNYHTSSPILTDVIISNNTSNGSGGGMHNEDDSSPVLTDVTISGNSAASGGGMANSTSSPTLTNVTISGNTATTDGGGMYIASSSPVLTNVILSGNFAGNGGGGMSCGNQSSPVLTNVTIAGNFAGTYAGGMYIQTGSPQIRNSVIWGNTALSAPGIVVGMGTIAYSIVQDSSYTATPDGGGNMNTDPQFMQLVQASSGSPTTGGNYRLKNGSGGAEGNVISPAINAGNNVYYNSGQTPDLSAITTDLAGTNRIQGGVVDMGAYER